MALRRAAPGDPDEADSLARVRHAATRFLASTAPRDDHTLRGTEHEMRERLDTLLDGPDPLARAIARAQLRAAALRYVVYIPPPEA